MTTFTKELDDILKKRTWWGDYQNDDGTWGTGISNRPELIKAILNLVSERIIGEDEYPKDNEPNVNYLRTPQRKQADKLRAEQRTTLYEGTKENK